MQIGAIPGTPINTGTRVQREHPAQLHLDTERETERVTAIQCFVDQSFDICDAHRILRIRHVVQKRKGREREKYEK